ncbi:hypothetical protein CLOP_g24642 [Closterium sp. NIES-67]|nr:hypothetical protein CLOP_g24642 [Closterium sp. NIES-67]
MGDVECDHFIGGAMPWQEIPAPAGVTPAATIVGQDPCRCAQPDAGTTGSVALEVIYAGPLPLWAKRSKRKKGSASAEGAGCNKEEEVTVVQRLLIHFYHVMMQCGICKRDGQPMTAAAVSEEICMAADHWAGNHSR